MEKKEDLVKCPFCAEWIKKAAIKCKHCKSDLTETEESSKRNQRQSQKPKKGLLSQDINCGCGTIIIIIIIIIIISMATS